MSFELLLLQAHAVAELVSSLLQGLGILVIAAAEILQQPHQANGMQA